MTDEAAARYEAWFESPRGRFAFARETALVERLISAWPRRQQKLLEAGCGPGLFLEVFYRAGFDITGIDSCPAMIARARTRLGSRADLYVGQAEHLPFDDKEFDFAALLTVIEFVPEPAKAILEAARVARKGILVGFLNRHSLYYLSKGVRLPFLPRSMLRSARWFTPGEVRALVVNTVGERPMHMRAVLPGPMCTWRDTPPWRWLNGFICPALFGAYCAVRVDFVNEKPLTPLLAFTREPAQPAGQPSF